MHCKQLVGPYAGQIIDLPFAVYQACKAAGTVVDVDAEHTVKGLKRGADAAPKLETKSPEGNGSVEPRRGVFVPMLLPETGLGSLNLPAINRPEDVGQPYFRKFIGDETVADGIYCEKGWPHTIEFSVEFVEDAIRDGFASFDAEGHLVIKLMNGEATYRPFGKGMFEGRTVFAEIVRSEFTPINEVSDTKKIDIPADWMDQHHNWKRARAADIADKPVGSKAEAEEIIKAYLAQK